MSFCQQVVLEGPREWHTVTDMTLNSGGQEVKDMILSGNEEDIIILSNSMVHMALLRHSFKVGTVSRRTTGENLCIRLNFDSHFK